MKFFSKHGLVAALLVALAAALAPQVVHAQRLLTGDFPTTSPLPDSCVMKVTNGAVSLADVPGTINATSRQASFSIASITTFGTYTLVPTCTWKPSIVNGTNTGTVTAGGTASSIPFVFEYKGGPATVPAAQLAP